MVVCRGGLVVAVGLIPVRSVAQGAGGHRWAKGVGGVPSIAVFGDVVCGKVGAC